LVLTKEDDPLIFDEEDSSIFVISLPSSENKAFGTIKGDHPEKVGKMFSIKETKEERS